MTKAKTQKHKEQLEAERAAAQAREAEAQRQAALQEGAVPEPDKKKKTEEEAAPEPVTIKKHSINDEDWEKIAEQFKQDFGRELEEDGSMVFPSHEAAVNFFTEQAAKKLEFLAMQMQDNKPTGFAVFSCGDGQLYQGTIEEIKAAIEIANQENPQAMYTKALKTLSEIPSFNPASSMRGALDNLKKPDVEEAPGSGPAPK